MSNRRDTPYPSRLVSPLDYLTGSRGPLRTAFDRSRQYGLGERVIKSAVSAAIAWEVAQFVPGNPNPVLAAMTGLFSINLTIAGSVRDAVQRVLGVIWGVGVALAANALVGLHGWSLALVVIISFAGGRRLGLESSGLSQMAVSALLVMLGAVGTRANDVAWLHFVNTLVGTGVGIVLNAAIAPPNYLPDARRAVRTLGDRVVAIHDELANALATGITQETAERCLQRAREIAATMDKVDDAIGSGEESLRYHILGSSQLNTLRVYRRSSRALEHTAVQTRVISRAIFEITKSSADGPRPVWIDPDHLGRDLAEVLSGLSVAIDHFLSLIDSPRHSMDDEALIAEVSSVCRQLTVAAEPHLSSLMPYGWTLLGEIIALAGQLVTDLSVAANEVAGLVNAESSRHSGSENTT